MVCVKSFKCMYCNTNVHEKHAFLTEGFQSVIWHLIVSHSLLQINKTKW